MLKSYGVVGGWVAYSILVSAQGPLVLGLGLKGLGLKVWGQGLTIIPKSHRQTHTPELLPELLAELKTKNAWEQTN